MHLLVGRENDCSGSKMPKRAFHTWLLHPPLVVWYDMREIILCLFIFDLLPFSYNASACKDQNQKWCFILICAVAKTVFSQIFGHFRPSSSLLVTMAMSNTLRERNIYYLNFNYNICGALNRAISKCYQKKSNVTKASLKGDNFTLLLFMNILSFFIHGICKSDTSYLGTIYIVHLHLCCKEIFRFENGHF